MNDAVRRLQRPIARIGQFGQVIDAAPRGAWLRERLSSIRLQFLLLVVVPTIAAVLYYGLVASPRYVSEAQYIVRGVTSNRSSGLSALLTTFGISRTADDTSAIQNYMESRDAIAALNERVNLREVFGLAGVDPLSRYPWFWQQDSFENLYKASQRYIAVVQDPTKGITTLSVQAFRAEDAQAIAKVLLELAEGMVNKMNGRAQSDSIRNATEEVSLAEAEITKAQAALTAYRNRELLVDPTSFSTILLQSISKLTTDLAETSQSLRETLRTNAASPVVSTLKARADALDKSIAAEREKLAGGRSAIADKMAAYEHDTLMRDMAARRFASALATLETARQEARRQQIYIEEMVRPNLPDDATEPHRFRAVMTVLVMAFAVFAMIWILTVGAKDHAQ